MGNAGSALEAIVAQSPWYGRRSQRSRAIYLGMKPFRWC